MRFTRIHAVIFDHDGTLVNSEPTHLQCWREVLQSYGVHLSQQDYSQNLSGMPSAYSAMWLAAKFNLDAEPGALLSRKQKLLEGFLTSSGFPLMPGILPLLNYLREREIPMAVATGASREEVVRSLACHKITPYFSSVVSKDDVKNNKPAPDVYQLAAAHLEVQTSDCLAIEDSDNGEKAARSAGMQCLRFQHTEHEWNRIAAGTFRTYEAIQDWIATTLEQ